MEETVVRPLIFGHRGASGQAPENTLAAFREALRQGAEGLELDIQFTRDERIVVLHDERLERTTNGRGWVWDMELREIQRLDAGSWFHPRFRGEPVPSLEEVLQWARETPLHLLIEIKGGAGLPLHFEQILGVCLPASWWQRVTLESFDARVVQRCRQAFPGIAAGLLVDRRRPDPVQSALSVGAQVLAPKARLLSGSLLEKARTHGLQIYTWTVNAEGRLRQLMGQGLEAIITDYPERALRVRREALSASG